MVRIRTSIYSESTKNNGVDELKEARSFMETVKPYLLGKELKAILITNFGLSFGTKNLFRMSTLSNYIKMQKGKVSWGGNIVFLIGDEQLEMDLWAPWQYKLGLNTLLIDEIVNNPSVRAPADNNDYRKKMFNVSEAYGNDIIGHKVVDVAAVGHDDDGEDAACEAVVIELDNHQKIKIFEDCDDVYIETEQYKIFS